MASRDRPLPFSRTSGAASAAHAWRDALFMVGLAFALRCWWFGDPTIQIDEQFYLVTGDRLLHGALPYVDIWDRKPIGLFLLYAGFRLLGGAGIIQYQVAATLFAATTAFLVVRIARHIASPRAARMAGAASLLFTLVFDGAGGQAPIFYNPLVAGAVLIVLRTLALPPERNRRFMTLGAAAMALIGIAMQIKYTALFEGVTLGLVLLWMAWRRGIRSGLIGVAALWIVIAIVPTAIAYLAYASAGHGTAFIFCNFQSIGKLPGWPAMKLAKRLGAVIGLGLPLIMAGLVGLGARQPGDDARRARLVLAIWLLGAVIGFFAIGTLYKHYFLPTVTPFAVFAAAAFDGGRRTRWRAITVLGLGLALAATTGLQRARSRGGERQMAEVVAAIRPHLTDRLYVFDADPVLYLTAGGGLATRFVFPTHLSEKKEAPALGVDQAAELRRVMASRPSVVVVTNKPISDSNPVTWDIMRAALARDYRRVGAVRYGRKMRLIYARNT